MRSRSLRTGYHWRVLHGSLAYAFDKAVDAAAWGDYCASASWFLSDFVGVMVSSQRSVFVFVIRFLVIGGYRPQGLSIVVSVVTHRSR